MKERDHQQESESEREREREREMKRDRQRGVNEGKEWAIERNREKSREIEPEGGWRRGVKHVVLFFPSIPLTSGVTSQAVKC